MIPIASQDPSAPSVSAPTQAAASNRSYSYTAQGAMTGDGLRRFTLNSRDQITVIAGVATYAYDGNGRRIKTTQANGTVEYTLYDARGTLVYVDHPAGTHTVFLQLGGKALAEVTNGTPTYLHADLLGSPRLATTASGQALWREHYDPYGQKLNGVNDKIGYTGHAFDAESGLTYAQARFYDAAVGRFLSVDPVGFTGSPFSFNRYSYANNNPYAYTDPTGMLTDEKEKVKSELTLGSRIPGGSGSSPTKTSAGPAYGQSFGRASASTAAGGASGGKSAGTVATSDQSDKGDSPKPDSTSVTFKMGPFLGAHVRVRGVEIEVEVDLGSINKTLGKKDTFITQGAEFGIRVFGVPLGFGATRESDNGGLSFGKFERFGSIENVQTTSQGQLTFGIGAGFGGEITTNLIDDIAKPAY